MLTFPLLVIMILYLILVFIPILFFLFALYHIIAAGEFSLASFCMIVFVGGSMITILFITFSFLSANDIQWTSNFSLFDNAWVTPQQSFE